MTCDEAKEQLVLLAYEELSDEGHAELELHFHGCAQCGEERDAFYAFGDYLHQGTMPIVSPNLLAASRMRLDDALDQQAKSTWKVHLRTSLVGAWQHVHAAPALATMLLGVGFLTGNLLTRYQVANVPKSQPPVIFSNDAEGVVGSVSSIIPMSDPDVVQVKYNRVIPMTFQGRIDEPQIRQLLMMGSQKGIDNGVRAESVNYLVRECNAGHRCEHGSEHEGQGLRDALLVSLRYDKSPAVRLKALEGLQRFIGEDQKVRDAVLESLMRDPNAEVRTQAIGTLEPVEGDSSVRQVLHTVSTQDENPYIRNASMQALGNVDGIQ